LNVNFGINNKRQDGEIGTECVCVGGVIVGGRRVNGVDENEGIWLMGFIYICEIE
jgi:hypothetical protein